MNRNKELIEEYNRVKALNGSDYAKAWLEGGEFTAKLIKKFVVSKKGGKIWTKKHLKNCLRRIDAIALL